MLDLQRILVTPEALFTFIPILIGIGCMVGWWRVTKFKRIVENVPTSKVRGVFIGLNEVKGNIVSENSLKTYLSESDSVWYQWSIEERWRKTESYTDKDGKRKTRTRSGWTTINSGDQQQEFFLKDETGQLLIMPTGADVEPKTTVSKTCSASDPIYYGKGPQAAIANSTHQRKFTEKSLCPGDRIYVIGPARLRDEVALPMIAEDEFEKYFLISHKSEEQIVGSRWLKSLFLPFLGLLSALAIPLILFGVLNHQDPGETLTKEPLTMLGTALVFFLFWVSLYLILLFNGLVDVRARLERAISLIDIQLKRRYDLIPQLAACVKGAAGYEKEVQTRIAAARTAAQNFHSRSDDRHQTLQTDLPIVGRLMAIMEDYPEIEVDQNYKHLFDQLVDTENRIALARSYYNDSLLTLQNRLQKFPDVIVALLFRFEAGTPLPEAPQDAKTGQPPVDLG